MSEEKEFLKKIGKRIASYRKKRNLSQTQLGDMVEMERSSVARLETGNSNATALTLFKISKALGVTASKFLQ